MKLKEYPREYEKVFTSDRLSKVRFKHDLVSAYNDIPSKEKYITLFRTEMKEFETDLFNHLVKYIWLVRRFTYSGKLRDKHKNNGIFIDRAFGLFMRNVVGIDNRFYISGHSLSKIVTYMDDFFPNFNEGNPFEENYEYPYQYMNLSCLSAVYQMEERMELLNRCDKRKMSYTQFLDYVLNYILCLNDELGVEKYSFIFSHSFMPYVKRVTKPYAPRGKKV